MDDDTLEPFSLDLDISLGGQTGQLTIVGPAVTQECVEEFEMDSGSEPESAETTEPELQETRESQEETETDKTFTENIPIQKDIEFDSDFDTKTRPQRLKRAPLRLPYDTPGHPSVMAVPTVKYVSCIYKWIGTPVIA